MSEFNSTCGEGSDRLYLDGLPGSKGLLDKPGQLTDRAKPDDRDLIVSTKYSYVDGKYVVQPGFEHVWPER